MKKRALALLISVFLILSSCSANAPISESTAPPQSVPVKESKPDIAPPLIAAPPQDDADYWKNQPPEQREYNIFDSKTMTNLISMDENGNVKDASQGALTETETVLVKDKNGKALVIERGRLVDTGKRDEYKVATTKWQYALFDANGKMLYDYSDYSYSYAFGDFLIRHEYYPFVPSMDDLPKDMKTGLWNYKTGQTLVDKAFNTFLVNDEKEWYAICGVYNKLLCVIDKDLNIIQSFGPDDKLHFSQFFYNKGFVKGFVVYEKEEDKEDIFYLLDKNLNRFNDKVYKQLYGDRYSNGEEIFYATRDNESFILDEDGNEHPKPEYNYYSDEELFVGYLRDSQGVYTGMTLTDKSGAVLAQGVSISAFCTDGRAESFAVATESGVRTIKRDGTTIKEVCIDGLQSTGPMQNAVSCTFADGTIGLLNKDLEYVIEPGKYVETREHEINNRAELYIMQRNEADGYTTDIYNSNFRLICEKVSNNYMIGYNRIFFKKGFYYVLMDFGGNIIAKESIFNTLGSD